jgi:dipeptidase E
MGFEVKNVDLKNKNRKDLEEELKGMDVIFVAGGNTFYLLEKVRESGFDRVAKKLINEGVVYIGSSAGAVLAGPTIEIINKMDDPADAPNLKSFKALNLVNFIVMPHFGDEKYKDIFDEAVKRGKDLGYEVKLLTNYQALIVNGGRVRLVSV